MMMEGLEKLRSKKKEIGNNHNFFTDDPDDPFAGKRFKGKSDPNEKKPCGICGKPVSKSNFNRHLRTHPEYEEDKDYGQSECTVFFLSFLLLLSFPLFICFKGIFVEKGLLSCQKCNSCLLELSNSRLKKEYILLASQ